MTNDSHVERFYSVPEIDDMIKTKDFPDFKYSLSDSIMFLLAARNKPIKGKTRQMKEVFLALGEVLLKERVQPVQFIKHRLGPYSEEVEYVIENLIASNYVSTSGRKTEGDFAIKLTPKGLQHIEAKYNNLAEGTRKLLVRKRQEWDTFISQGILKLVYTHYSDYLEHSVYKHRYEKLDWDNDNQRPEKK